MSSRGFPMHRRILVGFTIGALAVLESSGTSAAAEPAAPTRPVELKWRKHVINEKSIFEAAGVADFNGDGKLDILCGDSWYEAPRWTRHPFRQVPRFGSYTADFADLPLDVNRDGRVDFVSASWFTKKVTWVEHPVRLGQPWTEHLIDEPGNMETARLVDLKGDGRVDILPNSVNVVVWYERGREPGVTWVRHEVGRTGAGHGVGIGDVNGDGRLDILTPHGWYEQPRDAIHDPWPWHPEWTMEGAGILIIGTDVDGDGRTDVIYGQGHRRGLFWLQQKVEGHGRRWIKHAIDAAVPLPHTLMMADLEGTGHPVLVSGTRVYAHETDIAATDAPIVAYYKYDRAAGRWTQHLIDQGRPPHVPADPHARDAQKDFAPGTPGTGLDMVAVDIDGDGDLDLVCPGKTGLSLYENLLRTRKPAQPVGAHRAPGRGF